MTEQDLEKLIRDYIELHGWEKFKEVLQSQLGYTLVEDKDGKRVYQKPGSQAAIRKIDIEIEE